METLTRCLDAIIHWQENFQMNKTVLTFWSRTVHFYNVSSRIGRRVLAISDFRTPHILLLITVSILIRRSKNQWSSQGFLLQPDTWPNLDCVDWFEWSNLDLADFFSSRQIWFEGRTNPGSGQWSNSSKSLIHVIQSRETGLKSSHTVCDQYIYFCLNPRSNL